MATQTVYSTNSDTALVRGIRTGIQGALGVLASFLVGFILQVWNVPGVPEAVLDYLQAHLTDAMTSVGIGSGVAAFIWNALRSNIKNW